jgi:type IV pilus assembly protein PilY1
LDGNWKLGDDYIKLSTGVGDVVTPNGLASPAAIDINGDFDTEYIYAGDLQGNLWKFDVRDADPKNWGAPERLFTATNGGNPQPITTQPEVGKHPEGGVMVYFGTGKYLETHDHSTDDVQTQSFYGIRDKLESSASLVQRSDLVTQLVRELGDKRIITSENAYDDCTARPGWYLDLPSDGERQVTDSLLRNGRIIFTTLIPSTVPCSFGGNSWLMEFEAVCGNRLEESPFDLNNDHEFNEDDKVSVPIGGTTKKVAVSGVKSTEGIAPSPSVLFANTKEYKYTSGSTGGIFTTVENPGKNARGRMAWQQFK